MKESPILFSTPMVQAIADDRKTMTRRILPNVPEWIEKFGFNDLTPEGCISGLGTFEGSPAQKFFKNPYGVTGDRLWVRETWRPTGWGEDFDWMSIEFLAGGISQEVNPWEIWGCAADVFQEKLVAEALTRGGTQIEDDFAIHTNLPEKGLKWRPSIFMPRAACRTLLEITSIRVEKLWDITDEDAIAEGCRHFPNLPSKHPGEDTRWSFEDAASVDECLISPKYAFLNYWDKLNKKRGYGIEAKPWVWVVSFKKVEVDQ